MPARSPAPRPAKQAGPSPYRARTVALDGRLSIKVGGHLFFRPEDGDSLYNVEGGIFRYNLGKGTWRTVVGPGSFFAGAELDITVAYTIDRHSALHAGYGRFFPGQLMRDTGSPSPDLDWLYVEAVFTF